MTSVFISYSRRDKDFVVRLHNALAERGHDVWVDWEDIPAAAGWMDEIQSGIASADGFLYVISPDSVTSEVCGRELSYALELNKRVVPVVHREPNGATVPEAAATLNWVFLRDDDSFEDGLNLLISAVETDLDHVRAHTRLGLAASRWDAEGRNKSLLLRGSELASAEAWLVAAGDNQPEATQLQREYVLSSRQNATRRQRTVIGGVSFALLVAIALAVVALIQRSQAIHESNVAYAGRLDAEAQDQYPTDPELSVLLATKAAEVVPGANTEEALRAALLQSHVLRRFTYKAPDAGDVDWSPDGNRLLITHYGTAAKVYEAGDPRTPPVAIERSAGPHESGWDRAGNRVVIGGGHPGVFDPRNGRLIHNLPGPALYAAISADGSRVATVDAAFVAHVFEVSTGHQISSFKLPSGHESLCFAMSPDGRLVAECDNASDTSRLDVWNAGTGNAVYSIAERAELSSVEFSPDGSRLAFTLLLEQANPTQPGVFVLRAATGRVESSFPGSSRAAAFGPSDEFVYATSGDDLGHEYFFRSHATIVFDSQVGSIQAIAVGGSFAVLGGSDKKAEVFSLSTNDGQPVETLAGHTEPVAAVGIGLGDTMVSTAADDGTVRLWSIPAQPKPIRSVHLGDAVPVALSFTGHDSAIADVTADGGEVLSVPSLRRQGRIAAPPGQVLQAAAATQDGRFLVTVSGPPRNGSSQRSTTAAVYRGQTGQLVRRVTPPSGPIVNASVTQNGTSLATASTSGVADEWALPGGALIRRHTAAGLGEGAVYSQDGSMLAVARFPAASGAAVSAGDVNRPATIVVYKAGSSTLVRTIRTENVTPQLPGEASYAVITVAFSPDDHELAVTGVDRGVEVYDIRTGKLIERFPLDSFAGSVAFSPDGRLLAAGTFTEAYVWTLPSSSPARFAVVADTSGTEGVLLGTGVEVSFSQNSQILIANSPIHNTLAAYELSGGQALFRFSPVGAAAVSSDATRYAIAEHGDVSLFDCPLCGGLDQLLAVAKRSVTRGFTPEERREFLPRG